MLLPLFEKNLQENNEFFTSFQRILPVVFYLLFIIKGLIVIHGELINSLEPEHPQNAFQMEVCLSFSRQVSRLVAMTILLTQPL